MVNSLSSEELRKRIDEDSFEFETTADLPSLNRPLNQERALRSMEFGLGMESSGYNVFVVGNSGIGKKSTTISVLEEAAKSRPIPGDWVCACNFEDESRPAALCLASGQGDALKTDMEDLVQSLLTEIPKAFSGEVYEKEKSDILKNAQEEKSVHFDALEKLANSRGFLVQRGVDGLALVYTIEGGPASHDEVEKLPKKEKEKLASSRGVLQDELRRTFKAVKEIDRKAVDCVKELEKKIATSAIGNEISTLLDKYGENEQAVEYLKAVEFDIMQNLDKFRSESDGQGALPFPFRLPSGEEWTRRYGINVLVNNKALSSAPVVYESNPTYQNLTGRIEHRVHYGAFTTDFTLVKAGAMHRANGGYLLLDARDLLQNPFAYDALKRVLKDGEIRIEEIGEKLGLISTTTLKPEPIPARFKAVLLGTPQLYYMLQDYDEDFKKFFKVKGEFSDDMALGKENLLSYALLISHHCDAENLLPFHRDAAAAIAEHGLRAAEHKSRLSAHFLEIADLVREAHYWARVEKAEHVRAAHVQKALAEKNYRNNYLEEVIGRMIDEGSIVIETEGAKIGQVNGLSIYDMGDCAFGKPSRLTARVFLGKEGVVNIERESDLGGQLHNKGVLIIQGFFGSKYAKQIPLSFAATLCFEQSYGHVEGDSASSTELFALLSALGEIPIRQDLAVTGSVDQGGTIQAVGGINLKIEGFFKTCKSKGFTGTQGVIIPRANVINLMLDQEVVEAVERKEFHIYAISTVDEGMELLTGMEAGVEDHFGNYPKGSINAKIMRRLERILEQWKKLHDEG